MALRSLRLLLLAALLAWGPLAPAPSRAAPPPPGFADLVARLLPAVVNIASTEPSGGAVGPAETPHPPGTPPPHPGPPGKLPPGPVPGAPGGQLQSLGSGFIIDPAGLVVTNNHVIARATSIAVTLQDGTTLPAVLVGRDPRTDLALLKINPPAPLPFVKFGVSSHQRVGDWVVAIGNPFGLGGTVTAGIISAFGRNIQEGPYDNFIQTDAPINRGNSGGPLFDMKGDVIGINTAIFSPSGGSVGIAFAIPSDMARIIVGQLRVYGHAVRAWLGVRIQAVTPEIAQSLGLKRPTGALIAGVVAGGPAAKAAIRSGDVILKFAGRAIRQMHSLPRIVSESPIGAKVPMVIWRDGHEITLTIRLAEMPGGPMLAAATPRAAPSPPPALEIAGLGLKVAAMTDALRARFHLAPGIEGVVVTAVAMGGGAALRGLKPGDVIVEVQTHKVTTPAEVARQIGAVRKLGRPAVMMLIARKGTMRWVPVPLAGTPATPSPAKPSPG